MFGRRCWARIAEVGMAIEEETPVPAGFFFMVLPNFLFSDVFLDSVVFSLLSTLTLLTVSNLPLLSKISTGLILPSSPSPSTPTAAVPAKCPSPLLLTLQQKLVVEEAAGSQLRGAGNGMWCGAAGCSEEE